jgi:Tol biopolymer transport system component
MGEVYRARDTRLGREVAVKVLPVSLAADPDRLRRFEQEARAASALDHPHILAIHDVGTHDGTPYVVSELLEGSTLRERLGTPLPSRRVVEYALQIAQGLSAAHDKGIVHRDLKPDNLFVTKDGRVKILDFGLAKLTQPAPNRGSESGPTMTRGTDPGTVLGTIGYMAPEQVRGKTTDHRSDIFALGTILYEMLTGRRAFKGDTAADTMTAILKEEPPEISTTQPGVSPALERVVRHCLEKDPEARFQSARDLAFDLETISTVSGSGLAIPAAGLRRRRWAVPTLLAGACAVALTAGLLDRISWRTQEATPPVFHQLTFGLGTVTGARFASDAQTIVYSAAWGGARSQVFSTRPESPESRSLGLPSAHLFAVSPSGEMALGLTKASTLGSFWAGDFTLARAPLAGGTSREILEHVSEADWLPEGGSLAVVRTVGGRSRLEFPIGNVLYETVGWLGRPRVSPRGDLVAFVEHPAQADTAGIITTVTKDGKMSRLTDTFNTVSGLSWSPSGAEVWFSASKSTANPELHAVSLKGHGRRLVSAPGALRLNDVARDGRVLVTRYNARRGILCLTPGETKERDLHWHDNSIGTDLSPDGRTLVLTEGGAAAGYDFAVYLRQTDGSAAVMLGKGYGAGLSPDGKWVLAIPYGDPAPLVLLPTGAGELKVLPGSRIHHLHDEIHLLGARWFPDGKRVLFTASELGHAARCYVQGIADGDPKPVTPEGVVGSLLTPDGRLVTAVDREGRLALYPIDGGEPRQIPGVEPASTASGYVPIQWSTDGRLLYVYRPYDVPVRIFRVDTVTGRKEVWKELALPDLTGVLWVNPVLITPDGSSYAYSFRRELSDLYLVEGLK